VKKKYEDLLIKYNKSEKINQAKEIKIIQDQKIPYTKEKVEKLLKTNLTSKNIIIKSVDLEANDLSNVDARALYVKGLLKEFMSANKNDVGGFVLALPIYLGQSKWVGMVLKTYDEEDPQLIYIDPTGIGMNDEKKIQSLQSTIIKMEENIGKKDLKLKQVTKENITHTGALIVNDLITLARKNTEGMSSKKVKKLLLELEKIDMSKIKMNHKILEESANSWYGENQITKLLQLKTKDMVLDAKICVVDMLDGIKVQEDVMRLIKFDVLKLGNILITPIHLSEKSWATMVIKKDGDGLEMIYSDPTGKPINSHDKVMNFIHKVMDINPSIRIFDLKQKQITEEEDSGVIVVETSKLLAKASTKIEKDLKELIINQKIEIKTLHSSDMKLLLQSSDILPKDSSLDLDKISTSMQQFVFHQGDDKSDDTEILGSNKLEASSDFGD
jgi:hypothetical protein